MAKIELIYHVVYDVAENSSHDLEAVMAEDKKSFEHFIDEHYGFPAEVESECFVVPYVEEPTPQPASHWWEDMAVADQLLVATTTATTGTPWHTTMTNPPMWHGTIAASAPTQWVHAPSQLVDGVGVMPTYTFDWGTNEDDVIDPTDTETHVIDPTESFGPWD